MNKEGKKAMRKAYDKPRIAIEDFVLNQYIAGTCTIGTRNKNKIEIGDELITKGYEVLGNAIKADNYFAEPMGCVDPNGDSDGYCYHTQGSPLFTS